MIDALMGAVIMVVATTGMVLAVQLSDQLVRDADRYPLNADELAQLRSARFGDEEIRLLQNDLNSLAQP